MNFTQEFNEYLKLKAKAEKINKKTKKIMITVSSRIKKPK